MQNLMRYIGIFALTAFVASCGWVEVPPQGTTDYHPPSSQVQKERERVQNQKPRAIPGTVVVEKGDTVYAISRRHNVSMRALIDKNSLKPPFKLAIGQRLSLPQGPVHTIQKGDTLYSVSRQYRTDVYTLAKMNDLKPPFILKPGEQLRLPTTSNLTTASRNLQKPRISAQPKAKPKSRIIAKAKPRINRKSIPKPPPRASNSRFAWPIKGRILSNFGAKRDGLRNDGINIAAKRGTPVKAAENGVVAYSGNELRGFGNMILVKHSGGWITAYAHVGKAMVKRGEKVSRGQTIASVGSSGGVVTPQLHFEIRRGMNPVNPNGFLKG